MVVLWGADAVLLYNDAYRRMIGDKHPAALGGRAREVVPEVWEEVGPVFDRVIATGEAAEARHRALPSGRNGGTGDRWFDYALSPIRGFDGKVEGVLAIAHEVAETMEAEAERDRRAEAMRERRARAFISNLPGGAAFVVDRELRYLLADGEALQEAGMGPDDLQGKSIFEALEPELAASYEPVLRRALAGEPFSHEHERHAARTSRAACRCGTKAAWCTPCSWSPTT